MPLIEIKMKTMFRVWLSVIMFSFFIPFITTAQSYHRLAASDFAGVPTPNSDFTAYTNCYVSYSYNATLHNGNYDITFNTQLVLNTNKSWIRLSQVKSREMLESILKHEQGHYNIAYLMKSELYSVFTHHQYDANYQAEIVALFKQVQSKYQKLNDDYESQTQHMTDTQNQEKWNAWFSKQLDNVSIVKM
jgi:hypothetical protein